MHTSLVLAPPWRLLLPIVIFSLSLTGPYLLCAQVKPERDLRFKFLGRDDGLHAGMVYCVLEDRQGFIWLGTRFGLKRYDGYQFRSYDALPSDSGEALSGPITSLCEDSSGVLWVAVKGGSVASLDRRNNIVSYFRNDRADRSSLSTEHIVAFHIDASRRLWAVSQNWEMNLFDPSRSRFIRYAPPEALDPLGNGKGLQFLPELDGGIQRSTLTNDVGFNFNTRKFSQIEPIRIANGKVSIVAQFEDSMWLASSYPISQNYSTFFVVRPRARTITAQIEITDAPPLIGIVRDREGNMLILSQLKGLFRLDANSTKASQVPLKGLVHPSCIYVDRSDRVWIGAALGVYLSDGLSQRFSSHRLPVASLPTKDILPEVPAVRALHARGERMEAGDQLGFIYNWDSFNRRFDLVDRLHNPGHRIESHAIHQISSDQQGRWLYVANSSPLFIRRSMGSRAPARNILNTNGYAICCDHLSSLWIGASAYDLKGATYRSSLLRYDPATDTKRFYRLRLPSSSLQEANHVFSLYEDRHKQLWIGSSSGLFKYDRAKDTCIPVLHPRCDGSGHAPNNIWVIFEDSHDNLWLGSWGRGLHRFDRSTNTYTDHTTEHGLSNNNIQSILEDDEGDLWIGTSKGLSRFDPRTNQFTNFGIGDGLLDEEFQPKAATKLASGEMFFGGITGITSFFPSDIKTRDRYAPIALTSLHSSGKEMGQFVSGDTLQLDYDKSDLVFEYAALAFGANDRMRYEYMILGLDEDWIHAGTRRTASYNNIPPGVYRLRIKVTDGVKSTLDSEMELLVMISPPYWETWWFRLLIGISLVSAAGLVIVRGLRRQEDQQLRLERAREKERMDLAGDIHDGPLQDLYATRFLVGDESSELAHLLANVRGDLRSISSVLQPPKLQFGLIEELDILVTAFRQRCPNTSFELIAVGTQSRLPETVGRNIFRIARTALTNVQKHSKATSCEITVSFDPGSIVLSIKDNGVGFDPKKVDKLGREHFGLFLMKCYAKEIKATIKIDAFEGKGTAVQIRWSRNRFTLNSMRSSRGLRKQQMT